MHLVLMVDLVDLVEDVQEEVEYPLVLVHLDKVMVVEALLQPQILNHRVVVALVQWVEIPDQVLEALGVMVQQHL